MMSSPPMQMSSPNGPGDDDTFERDLKEMLKDGPSLNDLSSTVQAGSIKTEGGKPQAYIRPDNQASRVAAAQPNMPRSHTVPPATSNIPLSSPERNGQQGQKPDGKPNSIVAPGSSKLDTIRAWSINTYKCTRQMISERFGKGSKTVDLELEAQIEALRDMQRKYSNILRLARQLSSHFYHVVQTQRQLGDAFADLSQKSPELQEEFSYNSETQKALCKNGETLLGALNFFTSSVNTLCNKTMEDTLQTIKQYENARLEFDACRADNKVEYDAYRTDMEILSLGPRDSSSMPKMDDAQGKFHNHKEKYERLKADVAIKLKFLDENRMTVTKRQFYLLWRAHQAYAAGSSDDITKLIAEFNISKLELPESALNSPTSPTGHKLPMS